MEKGQAITGAAIIVALSLSGVALAAPRMDFSVTDELHKIPQITEAELSLASCVSMLPAGVRGVFKEPSQRGRVRLSGGDRERWQACAEKERDLADAVAIERLASDLILLVGDLNQPHSGPAIKAGQAAGPAEWRGEGDVRHEGRGTWDVGRKNEVVSSYVQASAASGRPTSYVPPEGTRAPVIEAHEIASSLIKTTRANAQVYRMVGSPYFSNFLVTIGMKEKGYCYHWVEALLKALPRQRFRYYERHWGGANVGRVTENNAVIITKKGAPVSTGIAYDVWRGAGRPWWRPVDEDHYKWTERYNESEVIAEYGTVTE